MGERMEYYKQGLALYGQDRHLEAIAAFQKCLAEDPNWGDALQALAHAQMAQELYDEAIETGKRLVEVSPDDPFVHTSLSMFYQRKGLFEEAETEGAKARMLSWKKQLETDPDTPPPPGVDPSA